MSDRNSETALADDRFSEIKSQAATLTYPPTKRAADELIAEIERLRAENAKLRDVLTWSEQQCPGQCAGTIREALS